MRVKIIKKTRKVKKHHIVEIVIPEKALGDFLKKAFLENRQNEDCHSEMASYLDHRYPGGWAKANLGWSERQWVMREYITGVVSIFDVLLPSMSQVRHYGEDASVIQLRSSNWERMELEDFKAYVRQKLPSLLAIFGQTRIALSFATVVSEGEEIFPGS